MVYNWYRLKDNDICWCLNGSSDFDLFLQFSVLSVGMNIFHTSYCRLGVMIYERFSFSFLPETTKNGQRLPQVKCHNHRRQGSKLAGARSLRLIQILLLLPQIPVGSPKMYWSLYTAPLNSFEDAIWLPWEKTLISSPWRHLLNVGLQNGGFFSIISLYGNSIWSERHDQKFKTLELDKGQKCHVIFSICGINREIIMICVEKQIWWKYWIILVSLSSF